MQQHFDALYRQSRPHWHVASDPAGSQLGSAGGAVYLLVEAWRKSKSGTDFLTWLRSSRKLIVHGGGRSRRLPAYGPCGKPFIPIPVSETSYGQRLDQMLIDLQLAAFHRILDQASSHFCVLITCGDVLLDFDTPPLPFPETDVLCFGMAGEPKVAENFGVLYTNREAPDQVLFMKQKPGANEITHDAATLNYTIDTGMWLLSEQAIRVLLAKSGWDAESESFSAGNPTPYDLYAQFGLTLGHEPTVLDLETSSLKCGVVSLPTPSFLHLGTNRQMMESVSRLQQVRRIQNSPFGTPRRPDIYVQNAVLDASLRTGVHNMIWLEDAAVPASWQLSSEHVLTGIPVNDWRMRLEPGICIDFAPVAEESFAVRVYGFDDAFHGAISSFGTKWLGRPIAEWFSDRGINPSLECIPEDTDIHDAPLFPILMPDQIDGGFLEWMFNADPANSPHYADLWRSARRVSAQDLNSEANLSRQRPSRSANLQSMLPDLQRAGYDGIFYRSDMEIIAALLSDSASVEAGIAVDHVYNPLLQSKAAMFRAALIRAGRQSGNSQAVDAEAMQFEAEAFALLRKSLIADATLAANPILDVLEDQIVWGRSPIRLDLAGGWTDTPPYCLQHGGSVVNIAVDLNGQPPIQVYVKTSKLPEIVIRSIDLGVEQRLRTYDDLSSYAQPGSEFALAKAALALAGFLPEFHTGGGYGTLEEHLKAFGSGIEVSMVAAIPAGSGLGTSSILAATLLASIGNLGGLNWSHTEIVRRTLVLEQMLTTGGGWQDPVGGAYSGLKLCETQPGMEQKPIVRWLPDSLFSQYYANSRILLYYTGITRMAKNILQDIVRGMFLNRGKVMRCLEEIAENAGQTANAIQLGDYDALRTCVGRSWELNKRLDSGTNPPSVEAIFKRIEGENAGGKLLGAGGGGYLLLLAEDAASGARIREKLTNNPLNPRARFVEISTSQQGLVVTRS